jgi:hypothetical protein
MDSRHKKKAILGVGLWVAAIPLMFAAVGICAKIAGKNGDVPKDIFGFLFLLFLIAQYLAFFWGGSHLARAKGYSTAILGWGIFCWLSQPILLAVLLFALPDKCPSPSDRVRKKKPGHNESNIARIVRYRRNALVANGLGVAGVLVALIFMFIPIGLFQSWDNAKVAGIFVFIPSYAAIIYGCWWWVRAKNWHDAVVFIGLCPLAPLAIPYVRILYLMTGVLPLMMVVMPMLLIGVVAALPDKSGMPKRKRWDRD